MFDSIFHSEVFRDGIPFIKVKLLDIEFNVTNSKTYVLAKARKPSSAPCFYLVNVVHKNYSQMMNLECEL